jgi:putative endonuclease
LCRESEEAAWQEYRRRGYRLVARNWRCRLGELDLVVARGRLLAFCEVKSRTLPVRSLPHDAVTGTKQRKVRALAEVFLGAQRGSVAVQYRFDVACVVIRSGGRPHVHIFEDAF